MTLFLFLSHGPRTRLGSMHWAEIGANDLFSGLGPSATMFLKLD